MAGPATVLAQAPSARRIAFNRHERAGAAGDLGTDLSLLMRMVVAGGFDLACTFLVFGVFQVLTGPIYGLPMQQLRGGVARRTPSA